MKKFFAMLLAVAMVACMGTTAFAAETTFDSRPPTNDFAAGSKTESIPVNVKVTPDSTATVYNVTVAWDALEFTYDFGNKGTWDPATHTYSNGTAAGWDKSSAPITVTNHSNAAVTTSATIGATPVRGVTASIGYEANESETLQSAEIAYNNPNGADAIVYSVSVNGIPDETAIPAFQVDTVTVTISK